MILKISSYVFPRSAPDIITTQLAPVAFVGTLVGPFFLRLAPITFVRAFGTD